MKLRQLWHDKESLKEVEDYLVAFLTELGVKRMFAGEEVKGIAEARDAIEKAFDNLDNLFGAKPKKKNNKNEAR